MPLRKKLALNWKLYVITAPNANRSAASLSCVVEQAILGGASAVQLRDKFASDEALIRQAKNILVVTKKHRVPLIINDRIEVARRSGADGVHLGQDDASLNEAREILGDKAIIGRSTHSHQQALAAQKEGFDYIGVGPIFATPTKPSSDPVGLDLLRFAAKNIHIPFVAIGGIDESNVGQVRKAGAKIVAVVRAVMASDNPKKSASRLSRIK